MNNTNVEMQLKNGIALYKAKQSKAVQRALQHEDKLGAGAKKRKKLNKKDNISAVMKEYKHGTLHSGSGKKVSNRQQAIAIALSESKGK